MANRPFYDIQGPAAFTKLISGNFACNGGSSPTTAAVSGTGYSVARTGSGQLRITLTGGYPQLEHVDADFVYTGAAALNVPDVVVTNISRSTGAFTVTTISGATATDFGTDLVVSFLAVARNTSLRR